MQYPTHAYNHEIGRQRRTHTDADETRAATRRAESASNERAREASNERGEEERQQQQQQQRETTEQQRRKNTVPRCFFRKHRAHSLVNYAKPVPRSFSIARCATTPSRRHSLAIFLLRTSNTHTATPSVSPSLSRDIEISLPPHAIACLVSPSFVVSAPYPVSAVMAPVY